MVGEPGSAKSSRLFLLRLWQAEDGWRGRLQDLRSGEAWSFAGWQELVAALWGSRPHADTGGAHHGDGDSASAQPSRA